MVNALWNHAATMRQEFAKKKLSWPELTAQDLTDMLVYLRNLPSTPNANAAHRDHRRCEWPGAVRLERMCGLP